ncbi:RNA polymerase sigma factor [Ktedonosporobacter rubrisoli]|uniref:RNA polymerase sigma factor n=1 Tax=Ktedonosporobacter rubrisoli TaxID=2509675 RepID=A0A4P6JWY1_KTERU|nr:RNA polymerase sigma factor [Ktedonosporobacter rubrisoli]QBD79903.1 RNA polymerase sigma factor [Ktedonosporobacter rubrisoli]
MRGTEFMEPGKTLADLPELLAVDLNNHFQLLVLGFQQRLYAFVLRQVYSPQDAEDIVQETFIRAYHALADYPTERIRTMKLLPWLYKIAMNIFYRQRNNMRLQYTQLDLSEESTLLAIEDNNQEQPENILEIREELHALERLIAQLPTHYRTAVNCYYFENLSYREIADLLHQPIGTVKSSVHRGLRLLRKAAEAQNSQTKDLLRGSYGRS